MGERFDEMAAWDDNDDAAWHAAERSAWRAGKVIGCVVTALALAALGAAFELGRNW